MQFATSNKPNRILFGGLAGALFLLAALIDGITALFLHHPGNSHALATGQTAMAVMFAAAGFMWLAITWRWKRADDRHRISGPDHPGATPVL